MVKGVATVTMAQVLPASAHAAAPAVATPSRPPSETGTLTDAEVTTLLDAAMRDANDGNWTVARQKTEQVLKVRPADERALELGAMTACQFGDRSRATRYFNKLGGSTRNTVMLFCQHRGVQVRRPAVRAR